MKTLKKTGFLILAIVSMLASACTDNAMMDLSPGDTASADATTGDASADAVGFAQCGSTCVTGKFGVCNAGTWQCSSPTTITCISNQLPAPTEICGNNLDDDCNGSVDDGCGVTTGCSANTPGYGGTCSGKYGVCMAGNGHYECGSNGALQCSTEVGGSQSVGQATENCGTNGNGNDLDDNCNGQTDEGCGVVQPTTGNAKVTVSFTAGSYKRILTVQATSNKADLGHFWNFTSQPQYGNSVTEDITIDTSAPCEYVLVNVIDSNPSLLYSTECVGNGVSATMNSDALMSLDTGGVYYGPQNLITWSDPRGTAYGCAGLFVKVKAGVSLASCGF